MRRQEYARNPHQRKASGPPPGLCLVGVEVSPAPHRAGPGTQPRLSRRHRALTPTHAGGRAVRNRAPQGARPAPGRSRAEGQGARQSLRAGPLRAAHRRGLRGLGWATGRPCAPPASPSGGPPHPCGPRCLPRGRSPPAGPGLAPWRPRPGAPRRFPLAATPHGPPDTGPAPAPAAASRAPSGRPGGACAAERPAPAHGAAVPANDANTRHAPAQRPQTRAGTVAAAPPLGPVALRPVPPARRLGPRQERAHRPIPQPGVRAPSGGACSRGRLGPTPAVCGPGPGAPGASPGLPAPCAPAQEGLSHRLPRCAHHTPPPTAQLPPPTHAEAGRRWGGRANLVAPMVPTAVGNPRACVPVPHRSWKPGPSPGGPERPGQPAAPRRGSAGSTGKGGRTAPLPRAALSRVTADSLHGIEPPRGVQVNNA